MDLVGSIRLRLSTAADEKFHRELYASTRAAELEASGWDALQKEAFITMQFKAQTQAYTSSYPDASSQIILLQDEPVGRILKSESAHEFVLVDISLLPQYRRQGIGTHLIDEMLKNAAAVGKPVRLSVFKTNRAKSLYERLGFSQLREDGMYCEMVWRPAD